MCEKKIGRSCAASTPLGFRALCKRRLRRGEQRSDIEAAELPSNGNLHRSQSPPATSEAAKQALRGRSGVPNETQRSFAGLPIFDPESVCAARLARNKCGARDRRLRRTVQQYSCRCAQDVAAIDRRSRFQGYGQRGRMVARGSCQSRHRGIAQSLPFPACMVRGDDSPCPAAERRGPRPLPAGGRSKV